VIFKKICIAILARAKSIRTFLIEKSNNVLRVGEIPILKYQAAIQIVVTHSRFHKDRFPYLILIFQ
jgi:hypothetical protein